MRDLEALYEAHDKSYSQEKIRSRAREDAQRNMPIPSLDSTTPFETELLHAHEILASKISGTYKSDLEKLDADIKGKVAHINTSFKDELARANEICEVKLETAEKSPSLQSAKRNYEQTKERFEEAYKKIGRLPLEYIPHWLYLTFAGLIFLGEIPLNALVFQIFGENQIMTWVMAFIIGLSVPLFAHFIGIKFREHPNGVNWANVAKGTAAFAMIAGALYGLSIMRQSYLDAFKEDLGLTAGLVETSILFYLLNIAVLVAAILVAYLSHDSVPGYQRLYWDNEEAKDRLEAEEYLHEKTRENIEIDRLDLVETARRNRCRAFDAVFAIKGKYDDVLKEGQEHERRILHRLRRDTSLYRHENLLNRTDGETPMSFQNVIQFPLQLETLKEKLVNEE